MAICAKTQAMTVMTALTNDEAVLSSDRIVMMTTGPAWRRSVALRRLICCVRVSVLSWRTMRVIRDCRSGGHRIPSTLAAHPYYGLIWPLKKQP